MAKNNVYKKIEKNRKPRVHVTYDIETGEGREKKELPFVVGVMSDLTGNNPGSEQKPLKQRKFINIDHDNFDQVMERMKPGVSIKVKNTLNEKDDQEMRVNLQFNKMNDFDPVNLAKNVPALNKLLNARNELEELLGKADRSEDLENLLEQVLQSTNEINQLSTDLKGTKKSSMDTEKHTPKSTDEITQLSEDSRADNPETNPSDN